MSPVSWNRNAPSSQIFVAVAFLNEIVRVPSPLSTTAVSRKFPWVSSRRVFSFALYVLTTR